MLLSWLNKSQYDFKDWNRKDAKYAKIFSRSQDNALNTLFQNWHIEIYQQAEC